MHKETVTTKIYKFDELSESAKEKAREWFRQGALDYDWWDFIYEDAARIGLKIEHFDIDRHDIGGKIKHADYAGTACKILKEHGEQTDTYILAAEFLKDCQTLDAEIESIEALDDPNDTMLDRLSTAKDEKETLEKEFEYALLQEYFSMLSQEVEYLMSDEQVDESILSNEYEFTEDGRRY